MDDDDDDVAPKIPVPKKMRLSPVSSAMEEDSSECVVGTSSSEKCGDVAALRRRR